MGTRNAASAGRAARSSAFTSLPKKSLAAVFMLAAIMLCAAAPAQAAESCPYNMGQTVSVSGTVDSEPTKRDDGYIVISLKADQCPADLFNIFVSPQLPPPSGCREGAKVSATGAIFVIDSIFPGRVFGIAASATAACTPPPG